MGQAGRAIEWMYLVESRYRVSVCGVCPRSGWQRKINQLDLWAQKRERIQNIVEVRRKYSQNTHANSFFVYFYNIYLLLVVRVISSKESRHTYELRRKSFMWAKMLDLG